MTLARRAVRDGLIVGLIAYAAVAIFYSAIDMLAARGPLFTVDLLGKAVFRGLRDPGVLQFPIPVDYGAVFSYNALHLLLSLAIGVIVTRILAYAERRPERAPLVLFVVVAGGVITVLVVGYLTQSMRPLLPWWSIVVANVAAAVTAGIYVLARHPGLRRLMLPGASRGGPVDGQGRSATGLRF